MRRRIVYRLIAAIFYPFLRADTDLLEAANGALAFAWLATLLRSGNIFDSVPSIAFMGVLTQGQEWPYTILFGLLWVCTWVAYVVCRYVTTLQQVRRWIKARQGMGMVAAIVWASLAVGHVISAGSDSAGGAIWNGILAILSMLVAVRAGQEVLP